MGVQTGKKDDCYCTYEEILTEQELARLQLEFGSRLKNACYLDHSGATLYSQSQIDAFHSELQSHLYSNPHSRNPSSSITTDAIDYIRLRILHHFGTTGEDYSVIFTSGATSALKLLAETFSFNGGPFAYLEESHTSVVGMREIVGVIKQVDQRKKREKKKNSGEIRSGQKGKEYEEEEEDEEEEGESESKILKEESTELESDSRANVYCLAKATLEKLMDSECEDVECRGRNAGSASGASAGNLESHNHREGPSALT